MQPQDIITSLNSFCTANTLPPFVFDRQRMVRLRELCALPKFQLNSIKIIWNEYHSSPNGFNFSEHVLYSKFTELSHCIVPANAMPIVLGTKNKSIALRFTREQIIHLPYSQPARQILHEQRSFLWKT